MPEVQAVRPVQEAPVPPPLLGEPPAADAPPEPTGPEPALPGALPAKLEELPAMLELPPVLELLPVPVFEPAPAAPPLSEKRAAPSPAPLHAPSTNAPPKHDQPKIQLEARKTEVTIFTVLLRGRARVVHFLSRSRSFREEISHDFSRAEKFRPEWRYEASVTLSRNRGSGSRATASAGRVAPDDSS